MVTKTRLDVGFGLDLGLVPLELQWNTWLKHSGHRLRMKCFKFHGNWRQSWALSFQGQDREISFLPFPWFLLFLVFTSIPGKGKILSLLPHLLSICKIPTIYNNNFVINNNKFAVLVFQAVFLSSFSKPILKWLLLICKQSTELKPMEEDRNSLAGIKYFIKHMMRVSLQMKTD